MVRSGSCESSEASGGGNDSDGLSSVKQSYSVSGLVSH